MASCGRGESGWYGEVLGTVGSSGLLLIGCRGGECTEEEADGWPPSAFLGGGWYRGGWGGGSGCDGANGGVPRATIAARREQGGWGGGRTAEWAKQAREKFDRRHVHETRKYISTLYLASQRRRQKREKATTGPGEM